MKLARNRAWNQSFRYYRAQLRTPRGWLELSIQSGSLLTEFPAKSSILSTKLERNSLESSGQDSAATLGTFSVYANLKQPKTTNLSHVQPCRQILDLRRHPGIGGQIGDCVNALHDIATSQAADSTFTQRPTGRHDCNDTNSPSARDWRTGANRQASLFKVGQAGDTSSSVTGQRLY